MRSSCRSAGGKRRSAIQQPSGTCRGNYARANVVFETYARGSEKKTKKTRAWAHDDCVVEQTDDGDEIGNEIEGGEGVADWALALDSDSALK